MYKKHIDNLDVTTSLLGYGCMRFPTKDGQIDEAEAEKLIDTAYAAGINYFDTAYPYHNGQSEPCLGRFLDKYPRDSYYLATKLPLWSIETLDDAKRIFNEQFERLHKDRIDFYLLHALNAKSFEKVKDLGIIPYLEEQKAAGRISFLGFSFHDTFDVFKDILEYRDWDFCQIQLNYMDTDEQAGMAGYALAESLGVPMIVMEPVKGGSLAVLPEDITRIFRKLRPEASTASWALRFVGSLNNVKVVLSGMTTMEQLQDNLSTFGDFEPLSETEAEAVTDTADALKRRVNNGCTGCKYCMPCPAGVNIPANFRIWNEYGMYQNKERTGSTWKNNLPDEAKASSCVGCGNCESVCPQHLNIRDNLAQLNKEFTELFKD